MRNEHHVFKLSNGIRIVYKQVEGTKIIHCGMMLDVGSRDENTANQGIAHFWEHMAFKGTVRRNSYHILSHLDAVGGELNAYTDKERVVFYASVRDHYFERAVDLLSDITFHSVFPESQIEKERGVILEEMMMYRDNPDDSLQDELEAIIYKGHPMGMNILGKEETIKSFKRKDFLTFFKNHVDTSRIVFSCVGSLPPSHIEAIASKYLNVKKAVRVEKRKKFGIYKPREIELERNVKQAKCAIGRDSFPIKHESRIPFFLLVNMLGGPGMNSRLNLALREKHGYVYSVEAQNLAYTDTGMFAIYFGTEPRQLDKCIQLVRTELDKVMDEPLTPRKLASAKEQLKGQLAMSEENNLSIMTMQGRSILDLGRIPLLDEVYEKIDNITAKQLQAIAIDMFNPKKLSCLTMIPLGD